MEEERDNPREFWHRPIHMRLPHHRHMSRMEMEAAFGGRCNVVMTRLNDEDLAKIDALVEVEIFKSRSEAVAFFTKEGMQARKDIFEKVMQTVGEIKQLKEKAKSILSDNNIQKSS